MSELPEEIIIGDTDNFLIVPKSHFKGSNSNDLSLVIVLDHLLRDRANLVPQNQYFKSPMGMYFEIQQEFGEIEDYNLSDKISKILTNRKYYTVRKYKKYIL